MLVLLDRYLLGEPVSKPVVVARVLAERSPLRLAAPYYRALEAVGTRAADEALIALRLVLAGHLPNDEGVRRLRALGALARAAADNDAATVGAILRKDGPSLALPQPAIPFDGRTFGEEVRAAYARALE
jgi:hypothetical protein